MSEKTRDTNIDTMGKPILDACCGSRMFYFNKQDERVLYNDVRVVDDTLCDGRKLEVHPDVQYDFRNLPFEDNSFYMVVFDPPHLLKLGENSWMAKKYGKLPEDWQTYLHDGFVECMRVLKPNGTLVFKWNERDIRSREVFKAFGTMPVFGDRSRNQLTHWYVFFKSEEGKNDGHDEQ